MQMRQTRQMQLNEDAYISNWSDRTATPETRTWSAGLVIFNVTYSKTLCEFVGPRKMVRLNWFVRQKVLGANIHETEGLLERNIAETKFQHVVRSYLPTYFAESPWVRS